MFKITEFLEYVSASLGMALAISCYAIIGSLFQFDSGTWLITGIALACLLCLIVAGATAELAMRFPAAPGLRTYFKKAFGNEFSLFLIFIYLSIVILIASVETYAFGEILQVLEIDISRIWTGVLLILLIAIVNLSGYEMAVKVQLGSVILLVSVMVLIACYAIVSEPIQPVEVLASAEKTDPIIALATIVAISLFLFVGFEWVTPMGRNAQAYQRMIPLSMVCGIVVLGGLYGLFAYASSLHLDVNTLQRAVAPQLLLGESLFGVKGTYILAGLSFLAMFTSFNVGMLGASRLVYAVAREGELPAWFTRISLRTLAPYAAIITLSVCSMLSSIITNAYALQYELANTAVMITCLIYTAIIVAVLRLRKTQGELDSVFALPRYLLIPMALVFLVLAFVLLFENLATPAPFILVLTSLLSFLYAYRNRFYTAFKNNSVSITK